MFFAFFVLIQERKKRKGKNHTVPGYQTIFPPSLKKKKKNWLHCSAHGILVPQPGTEPGPWAAKAWSPSH